ncbi:MAG: hypothetical protein AMXMBFR84_31910 [Candidatus Hydrogenedentota bacterium]
MRFRIVHVRVIALLAMATACTASGQGVTLKEGDGLRWFKGNTHTHSLWSDGDAPPEVALEWYKSHGYDFLCMSEHNTLMIGDQWRYVAPDMKLTPDHLQAIKDTFGADWVVTKEEDGRLQMKLKTFDELQARFDEPGKFLSIQAEEITSATPSVHVNGVNVGEPIKPRIGGEPVTALIYNISAVEDQGKRLGRKVLAHINHPNWGEGLTAEDIIASGAERFFEVYNGHGGVRNWGDSSLNKVSTDRLWDIVLAIRLSAQKERPLYGVGTDDAHNYYKRGPGGSIPGRGWCMVLSPELSAEALIEAMHKGHFYASSGVVVDEISWTQSEFRVQMKSEPGVTYTTQFIGTMKGVDTNGELVAGEDGKSDRNTKKYSDAIGKVLLETTENPAVYPVTGNELYVRVKIVSSKLKSDPFKEGDVEMAWVQPIVP